MRAGAQTSLARLVNSAPLQSLNPAVLVGIEGWLSDHLVARSTPVVVTPFPSPRSLGARLTGCWFFTRRAQRLLDEAGIRPRAIVANDHQECPLALTLAARLGGIPVLGILRTSRMNRRNFDKYRCDACDHLMAVGPKLHSAVRAWTTKTPTMFEEGFCDDEFMPPLPESAVFPRRLLIIGSEAPGKGFTDFIEALDLVEQLHPGFPALECDFTGSPPSGAETLLGKKRRSQFRFLGRVDEFTSLVRRYPLAIHPSRAETFGMAPIEAILAGVPTLVSETGIVESLPISPDWRFPPQSPSLLADRLIALWQNWTEKRFELLQLQESIRSTHHINQTAAVFRNVLSKLDGAEC